MNVWNILKFTKNEMITIWNINSAIFSNQIIADSNNEYMGRERKTFSPRADVLWNNSSKRLEKMNLGINNFKIVIYKHWYRDFN